MKINNIFKYIFILIVIVLIVFAVYSIYKDDGETVEQEHKEAEVQEKQIINNIRLGVSKYDTMNPILSNNKAIQNIDKIIFEPLIKINEDFSLTNCLAKEYSKIGDSSYLIRLRDDVKWHDGAQFEARDVQFTIDMLKSENVASIYKENVSNIVSVDFIDNTTIKINLDSEVPFFEYNLIFPILPYHYYIDSDFVSSTKIPIGTGMYKIRKIEDSYIELGKNEEWWNKENSIKLETININRYSSMGELYNAFKIGNIDMISTTNSNFNQYIGTIGFNVKEYNGREYDFLAMNAKNNVLQKKEVRQAIASAIDKNNIIATIYNNTYTSSVYPLDYGNYLYKDEVGTTQYSPETAQKVLTDNGWVLSYGTWNKVENYRTIRTTFNLIVNSSNEKRVAVAENIKNQLKEVGIEINVRKVSDAQYAYYLENKNYDLILTGSTISASPDMKYYFGYNNLGNIVNEEAMNIVNDVRNISDKKVLQEKYKRLQEIYQEEVYYISLYRNREYVIYSLNLIGDINPNWFNIYYNIENWYRQN